MRKIFISCICSASLRLMQDGCQLTSQMAALMNIHAAMRVTNPMITGHQSNCQQVFPAV